MSKTTKISWCDSTVNFWEGCAKVSPGCSHCYAEDRDKRWHGGSHWGKGASRRKVKSAISTAMALNRKPLVCACGESFEDQTLHGPKLESGMIGASECCGPYHQRRIFSLSLGDWLDPEVPTQWLAEMLDTIRLCVNVDWLLLTKRPELWESRIKAAQDYAFAASDAPGNIGLAFWLQIWIAAAKRSGPLQALPPKNVWIGVTVEDQERAWERIPILVKIPAAVRFLSCEPLLEDIDLELRHGCRTCNHPGNIVMSFGPDGKCERCHGTGHEPSGVDWVIVGGESGSKSRRCCIEWIKSIKDQCQDASIPCFVKQLGGNSQRVWMKTEKVGGKFDGLKFNQTKKLILRQRNGNDIKEWPEDLQIQEFPNQK